MKRKAESPPAGLEPVATDELPVYAHSTVVLLDPSGASLDARIRRLAQVQGAHRIADYREEGDLRAGLMACAYHVEQIICLYAERTTAFEALADHSTLKGNTSEPRVYYEVSAFLTEARAWYETLRRLLRARIVGTTPGDEHFTEFIKNVPPGLAAPYETLLGSHWRDRGIHLNKYRNVIVHQQPISEWGNTCWFEPHDQRFGMTVRLPENPKVSREKLDFEGGPDALDYCRSYLYELTDLAEATCQLREIRRRLDNPPRLT